MLRCHISDFDDSHVWSCRSWVAVGVATATKFVAKKDPMRRVVKLEVQPNVREGAVARRIASAALQEDHANAEEIADVELVTSELITNAVEASKADDPVTFSMELSDADVQISVANQGDDFEPNLKPPNADDFRGRGLAIVGSIGDVTVQHDEGTTTVSVDIPLSNHTSEAVEVLGKMV